MTNVILTEASDRLAQEAGGVLLVEVQPTSDIGQYLAEITAYEKATASVRVLRFSTGLGFTSGAGDSPAHTTYDPRLEQAVEVTRTIFAPGTTQGQSKTGFGNLVILNPDGALDGLLNYAFDGRDIIVKRGPTNAASLDDFVTVFVGTMEQADFSTDRITLKLRDRQAPLHLPVQTAKYAGTNVLPAGLEGVAGDLAGKPKPLCYGVVFNVEPPCVNTARLIYQVNDGAVQSVDSVYDRGVTLTNGGTYASQADLLNDTLQPAAGAYKAWLAGGMFRLGSSPAGTVTADVTQGATAAERTAAMLYRAILLRMGVTLGDILASDLTTLDAQNAAQLGLYIGEETKGSDVLDMIANTVGAWWGVNIAGQYRIALLEKPFATPLYTFTANDMIGPLVRLPTADVERGMPAYRVTIRYARNYTIQTDLAGGVADARRAVVAQEWREATRVESSVQTVHLLAVALEYNSLFAYEADAILEANRRLALRSVQRHRFEVTTQYTADTSALDLGDVVGMLHPRYGLDLVGDTAGQTFVLIGVEPDAQGGRLRLTLWGNSFDTFNIISTAGEFLATSTGDYLVTGAS
jgi:hypothetical protein